MNTVKVYSKELTYQEVLLLFYKVPFIRRFVAVKQISNPII
jgi:hypothetical protein